jgi:endonuclease YncB( thermonuclease family)
VTSEETATPAEWWRNASKWQRLGAVAGPGFLVILVLAAVTGGPQLEGTATAAAVTASSSAPTSSAPGALTVLSVVDGRTVVTSDSHQVRLSGLAVPGACWAPAAIDFLQNNVVGKQVTLTVETDGAQRLARVQLTGGGDASQLAVSRGFGKVDPAAAAARTDLTQAENAARQAKSGLWGDPCRGSDTAPPPTSSAPPTQPTSPSRKPPRDVYFRTCADAWRAGAAPILRGQPGYRDALDRNHDGIACEPGE